MTIPATVTRTGLNILFSLVICASFLQYLNSVEEAKTRAQWFGPWRVFFERAAGIIMSQPSPRYYSYLFDEQGAPFINHLWYHHHLNKKEMNLVGYMSVHDSYYKTTFQSKNGSSVNKKSINLLSSPTLGVEVIATQIIQQLEAHDGTIVFAYCSLNDITTSSAFNVDSKTISIPVAQFETNYLLKNPHWKVIDKIETPRGCLYAYKYSKILLTNKLKWQAVL
jgi:hypothetical protein